MSFLQVLLLMACICFAWMSELSAEVSLYVSPEGNDSWSGSKPEPTPDKSDGPFATIERARDAIREMKQSQSLPQGGITVFIRKGDYYRTQPFELTYLDSGARDCPITYRAYPGERVRFLGGKRITNFSPVSDSAVLERFQTNTRSNIVQANLMEMGITDFGSLRRRGFGIAPQPDALGLFFDGAPMTRARWPNGDWARIASVPDGEQGAFRYDGDRPSLWRNTEDIWVHGYWTWDWADSREKVATIDTSTRTICTQPPHGVYGYKAGARFYAENILEELDAPGEYYVDTKAGILYFWPPSATENVEALVSLLEKPFVTMDGVSFVSLRGITFECSRGPGIIIRGGSWNRVAGCAFANLSSFAIDISPTSSDNVTDSAKNPIHNGVISCNFRNLGEGGVSINGGDRKTLKPGSNFVVNCDFDNYSYLSRTYRCAIYLNGVRNRGAHNHIRNAPHMAIGIYGNEHIVEFNKIHHVCMETHDAGAFYMGRDWTCRQNVVRFNFFYELGKGDVQAIYLDDWTSDTIIFGNVCYKAGRGVLIGGGRDNVIDNNIFIECTPALHIDQRGLGWAKYYFDGNYNTLFERLYEVNADSPTYRLRYPQLTTLVQDQPAKAKYNHILRNISVGGRWIDLFDGLTENDVDIANNWVQGDPLFIDAANKNFQLHEDSPVYELGFQRIPFEQIGTYEDDLRHELETAK
ncbi:MAG TPA: right-handed parallel beta-helix repeat-containing protein [Candidatus Hydrogenedentes bacterium]|nr:right-handed parallel beta-helix repeat-containing protein [Candidatus Hydrogenedentota bacterium]HPO85217.1 right-handed parallel beta-helix repeat-containing protein [Candidatus Hydrogenedentota bacterium]